MYYCCVQECEYCIIIVVVFISHSWSQIHNCLCIVFSERSASAAGCWNKCEIWSWQIDSCLPTLITKVLTCSLNPYFFTILSEKKKQMRCKWQQLCCKIRLWTLTFIMIDDRTGNKALSDRKQLSTTLEVQLLKSRQFLWSVDTSRI